MDKTLRIPAADIPSRRPDPLDLTLQEDDIRPEDVASIGLVRADIHGSLRGVDTDYLFEGKVTGHYLRDCDRCLEPTEARIDLDITWLFSTPGHLETDTSVDPEEIDILDADENSEVLYFHDDTIDLADPIWEELVMATPTKVHCSEDCKGLCPRCGQNLNLDTCACAGTASAGGAFDGLKELLPDLPSGSATADES